MDDVFSMEVPQATENLAAPSKNSGDRKWNFVSLVDALFQVLLANLHDCCNFTPIVRVKARVNFCNISMAKVLHHLDLLRTTNEKVNKKKSMLEPLAKSIAPRLAC